VFRGQLFFFFSWVITEGDGVSSSHGEEKTQKRERHITYLSWTFQVRARWVQIRRCCTVGGNGWLMGLLVVGDEATRIRTDSELSDADVLRSTRYRDGIDFKGVKEGLRIMTVRRGRCSAIKDMAGGDFHHPSPRSWGTGWRDRTETQSHPKTQASERSSRGGWDLQLVVCDRRDLRCYEVCCGC